VVAAFVAAGADVAVLCFTRGEASTLHGVEGELAEVRAAELRRAGEVLGVGSTSLLSYADSGLSDAPLEVLAGEAAARAGAADGLLVFDDTGITGHPDHRAATAAALVAAHRLGIPVLAWTLPHDVARVLRDETGAPFAGREPGEVDLVIEVDRARQRRASLAHASQALPTSVLWRRLELLGNVEHLRWL
jgi:LmbE family N-acetylglucosaminyl deacetylase